MVVWAAGSTTASLGLEHYAELVGDRDRNGRPISVSDRQIAAICRCHGAALATRHVRDFDATGIAVRDPWTAD